MQRNLLEDLKSWQQSSNRQPLILVGARQVGKTWLLKHFGETCFENMAYYSFDDNDSLNELLEHTVSPKDILPALAAATGVAIEPHKTLIVFDEVQESPRALLSLKYFCEEASEYHVAAAGSTLGVMLHNHASFPVGKVESLNLHPLCFTEFLAAVGEGELSKLLLTAPFDVIKPFHAKLVRLLKEYFFVGGMPAAVQRFADNRADFEQVRRIQESILWAYDRDFSKYSPAIFAEKLRQVWNSLPSQLSKQNRKFTYAGIKSGARGREYDAVLQWLADSSMIGAVSRVSVPYHPLKAYEVAGDSKIFVNDIGLLGAMADLREAMLLQGHSLFVEFKGALAEQYVFQELRATLPQKLYYWTKDKSTIEIDFLLQNKSGQPVAVEAKAGINLRSRSLKQFMATFEPPYALRVSLADYKHDEENRIYDLPLYALCRANDFL